MAQMNISVPNGLKQWAEQRVADGSYASTSDYVRDLMRRDREAAAELAWLQTEIDHGMASGVDQRPVAQVFADIRAKYLPRND
jgi:antitoxin ParD1/3/4